MQCHAAESLEASERSCGFEGRLERTQNYAKLHIRVVSTKVKIKGDFVAQMI